LLDVGTTGGTHGVSGGVVVVVGGVVLAGGVVVVGSSPELPAGPPVVVAWPGGDAVESLLLHAGPAASVVRSPSAETVVTRRDGFMRSGV